MTLSFSGSMISRSTSRLMSLMVLGSFLELLEKVCPPSRSSKAFCDTLGPTPAAKTEPLRSTLYTPTTSIYIDEIVLMNDGRPGTYQTEVYGPPCPPAPLSHWTWPAARAYWPAVMVVLRAWPGGQAAASLLKAIKFTTS